MASPQRQTNTITSRRVFIAAEANSSKGGGVFYAKTIDDDDGNGNNESRQASSTTAYYKIFCSTARFGSMHSSYFDLHIGTSVLMYFQHQLRRNDIVTFLMNKSAVINLSPNSEFSRLLQDIKRKYDINIKIEIVSKSDNIFLRAADHISKGKVDDAHTCLKSTGAEYWP